MSFFRKETNAKELVLAIRLLIQSIREVILFCSAERMTSTSHSRIEFKRMQKRGSE